MFTFEKSVGAVVFRRENNEIKYLLLNHGGDYWNFPKGHTEAKETNKETLRREIEEETGLTDVQIMPSFKHRAFYFYQAKGREKEERKVAGREINIFKMVVFYLAEAQNQDVHVSSEHTGFEWLKFEEALEKLQYKSSKKLLRKVQKELEKHFAKKESLS
ncbi:NUDIX domain-containing protein [Patescibacteria group bacterium]|nr:NUDIX domain-containing protein [Patescibacteria group bacterium]